MENLYFIAIIPPKEIQDKITQLKLEVANRFNSRHALKSPPHITIHMPFKWKEKRIAELHHLISNVNNELSPFQVELNGFDGFEPRVIFVHVVQNEALKALQKQTVALCKKELKLDNANYKNRPFHPHVTIGFRDLRKKAFYEAYAYYQAHSFAACFDVSSIQLLKHNGKEWEVVNI